MSNFNAFMRKSKIEKPAVEYVATESLIDPETGEPAVWKIKPLSSKKMTTLRECCMTTEIIKGTSHTRVDSGKLTHEMLVASIVHPDLDNAELQDSYGVKEAGELLYALVDDTGEYNALSELVTDLCGFKDDVNKEIDEAKN